MTDPWQSVQQGILKSIPSPGWHEHLIETGEFTFLGASGQADFIDLSLQLQVQEGGKAPELKSVKLYLAQYRNVVMSYERAAWLLKKHFTEIYNPTCLDITLRCQPRGGLRSTIYG